MKKLLTIVCAVALVFCTVGIAQATTYYEEYSGHQYVGEGQSYNFGFDFVWPNTDFGVTTDSSLGLVDDAAGAFDPFIAANLHVRIWSIDNPWEKIGIQLTAWDENGNPDGVFNKGPFWQDLDGSPSNWTFHYALTPTEVAAFDEWGWGNVKVKALPTNNPNHPNHYNDFVIKKVAMDVTTAASVPEPATMALFGIGLVGLVGAGARQKLKKEKKQ